MEVALQYTFLVYIDADPTLGNETVMFDHAQRWVTQALTDRLGHYNPTVHDTMPTSREIESMRDKLEDVCQILNQDLDLYHHEVYSKVESVRQQLTQLFLQLDNRPF